MTRLAAGLGAAVLLSSCVARVPPGGAGAPVQTVLQMQFDDGDPLALHLSEPPVRDAAHPLVLFATGDGGWRGKDKQAFERMTAWGYPLAGFSAPAYLHHLVREDARPTPADVAADFATMIAVVKGRFAIPAEARTVLVGVSRGAGLAVAAAGDPRLRAGLAGVVAVALTREEEYVHRRGRRTPRAEPEAAPLDTYAWLRRLGMLPLSIIQSTHDNYLPAAAARRLLGPDSTSRQLHPIASKNHSFTDARDALYAQMEASLAWVARRQPDAGRAAR